MGGVFADPLVLHQGLEWKSSVVFRDWNGKPDPASLFSLGDAIIIFIFYILAGIIFKQVIEDIIILIIRL